MLIVAKLRSVIVWRDIVLDCAYMRFMAFEVMRLDFDFDRSVTRALRERVKRLHEKRGCHLQPQGSGIKHRHPTRTAAADRWRTYIDVMYTRVWISNAAKVAVYVRAIERSRCLLLLLLLVIWLFSPR